MKNGFGSAITPTDRFRALAARLLPACFLPLTLPLVCLLNHRKHFRIWIHVPGIHGGDGQARVAKVKAEEVQANLLQVLLAARFLAEGFPPLSSLSPPLQHQETFCAPAFFVPLFPLPWPSTGRSREWCLWCVCSAFGLEDASRPCLSLVAVVAICGLVQCLKEVDLETLAPVGFTMQVLRKRARERERASEKEREREGEERERKKERCVLGARRVRHVFPQ
jgi:hypothetical protein